GDTLALRVVGVFLVAGEHIRLVGFGGRLGRGFDGGLGAAAGDSGPFVAAATGGEQTDRHGQCQQDTQQTFHVTCSLTFRYFIAGGLPPLYPLHYSRRPLRGQPRRGLLRADKKPPAPLSRSRRLSL